MPGPRPQTQNGKTRSNLIIEPVPGPSGSSGLSAPIDLAPRGPDDSDQHLAIFQWFVLLVECGNSMKKTTKCVEARKADCGFSGYSIRRRT